MIRNNPREGGKPTAYERQLRNVRKTQSKNVFEFEAKWRQKTYPMFHRRRASPRRTSLRRREMAHFAFPRRNFIRLFYRESEIFLPPRKKKTHEIISPVKVYLASFSPPDTSPAARPGAGAALRRWKMGKMELYRRHFVDWVCLKDCQKHFC